MCAPTGGSAIRGCTHAAALAAARVRYDRQAMPEALDFHTYSLSEAADAEDGYWHGMPLGESTACAISRRLEREHGWDRARPWRCSLPQLRAAVGLADDAVVVGLAGLRGSGSSGSSGSGNSSSSSGSSSGWVVVVVVVVGSGSGR